MKAVILAAGKGTRLGDLTIETNKILVPVGGRKIIEYVFDNLSDSKYITEAFVAVSYYSELVKNYLEKTQPRRKIDVMTINALGWETGGDLKSTAYEAGIGGDSEPFLVCYGDNLTKIDVDELIDFHKKKEKTATVALFPVPEDQKERFGIAEIDEEKIIKRFVEKPKEGETESNLANAGYIVAENGFPDLIPYGKFKMESAVFPKLAKKGDLAGYEFEPPYWIDIGTPTSYDEANVIIYEQKGIIAPPTMNNKR